MKVGSAAGGVTPSMADRAWFTDIPSMPYSASQIARTAGPEVPEPVPPWVIIMTTT